MDAQDENGLSCTVLLSLNCTNPFFTAQGIRRVRFAQSQHGAERSARATIRENTAGAESAGQVKRIIGGLLDCIEGHVFSDEPIAGKDLRVYTGALKDIQELESRYEGETVSEVRVSFAGERTKQAAQ